MSDGPRSTGSPRAAQAEHLQSPQSSPAVFCSRQNHGAATERRLRCMGSKDYSSFAQRGVPGSPARAALSCWVSGRAASSRSHCTAKQKHTVPPSTIANVGRATCDRETPPCASQTSQETTKQSRRVLLAPKPRRCHRTAPLMNGLPKTLRLRYAWARSPAGSPPGRAARSPAGSPGSGRAARSLAAALLNINTPFRRPRWQVWGGPPPTGSPLALQAKRLTCPQSSPAVFRSSQRTGPPRNDAPDAGCKDDLGSAKPGSPGSGRAARSPAGSPPRRAARSPPGSPGSGRAARSLAVALLNINTPFRRPQSQVWDGAPPTGAPPAVQAKHLKRPQSSPAVFRSSQRTGPPRNGAPDAGSGEHCVSPKQIQPAGLLRPHRHQLLLHQLLRELEVLLVP